MVMLRARRRLDAVKLALVRGTIAAAVSACEARPTASAQESAIDRLVTCARAADRAAQVERPARMAAMASWLEQEDGCARAVFRGCVEPGGEPVPVDGPPERTLIATCLRTYCGHFASEPALCSEARAEVPGAAGPPTEDDVAELLAAKLAVDHGLDPQDPRVDAVARTYARFLAVEAMRDEPRPGPRPLALTVEVSAAGYTIRGTGIATTILAADPRRPLAAHDRWDHAALARAAKQLKTSFPAESAVEIQTGDDISIDVLTRTIDALMGEGCTPPGDDDPRCLFWRPVVVPRG